MKRTSKVLLVIVCVYSLFFQHGISQTKDELESKKQKQLKELEYASSLLKETKKNRKNTINELLLINKRIELREELIDDILTEIKSLESNIADNQSRVTTLKKDIQSRKDEYEALILFAFKNRTTYTDIVYVLAAESMDEAYKRYQYLRRLTDYRKRQIKLINNMKDSLENKIAELEGRKEEKEILLIQRKEEQATLQLEKEEKDEYIANMRNKENELKAEIERKEKILDDIEKEIDNFIAEEAGKSRSGNLYERLTPTERIVSNEFSENKGRLPWPTEEGIITGKYGEQPHPVLKGVRVRNNGVDISTSKNALVKSVFNGEVTLVTAIPGGNYAVIVRHGDFFTVYQNINRVKVKQGDKVETNQPLGYVYSEKNESSGVLHFELRKEYEKLNPEDWLTM